MITADYPVEEFLEGDEMTASVMNVSVIDNHPSFSGVHGYALHLSYYLNIPLISIYDNHTEHYYLHAVKNLLLRNLQSRNQGVVITSSFMAVPYVTNRADRTVVVLSDPFLWKYGGNRFRVLYELVNLSMIHAKKVFISRYARDQFDLEGTVIYPFVHKSFFWKRQMLRGEYGIIDAGNYPNKDVPYHESVVKNNDIKFIKFGAPMVHDNVEYVRGASFDTMSNYYSTAKFLLYLTKDEGFGYPLAQAMLSELPVVMRDIPINREVYGDSKYYDNDLIGDNFRINRELLEDIVHDKDTLMEKRKRALEMLDPEKLIARWKKVIEEAME